ncbi:hypothetical protein BC938DRAFT_472976 [Jimgerdemannia flammicorona]|uniref:Protein YIF1 n=1 Tax=Jimgerdemannia flammicorona TaxID=994334 RepID=A0A433QTK7_9FUNG|nr:hypothetical protein BC938DRAFT_472976 [Jimgerdemannia flammicorona]
MCMYHGTVEINRWVNIPALKHYFKVNNLYVVNKIRLLLFPWRHKPWTRMVKRSENGQMEGFRPPREDINSPDLYIPVMAFVTYVLLVGLVTGRESKFHPEVLGLTASTALGVVTFELIFIRLGCYLLNITSEAAVLDLVAYAGYKFVGIVVAELAELSMAPPWLVWGAFIYAALSIGFFLVSF